jgi:hypothetical protein
MTKANGSAPSKLVAEAHAMHARFKTAWVEMRRHTREFGEACEEIKSKEYFKYIELPGEALGSEKCFTSFEEYIKVQTQGECSLTFVWEACRIYGITVGENPIEAAVVDEIPKKNVLALTKLPPKKRTKKLVAAARKESINQFAKTIQAALNEDLPPEEQKQPFVDWHRRVHPDTAEMMDKVEAEFMKLKGVVRDGDYDLDLTSKAWTAICNSALSWASDVVRASDDEKRESARPN